MEGKTNSFFRACFISGLKDEIIAHVLMAHPKTWLEATKHAKKTQQVILTQRKKPSFIPLPNPPHSYPSDHSSQGPKINTGGNGRMPTQGSFL
jgi:hypothetical protein